MRQGDFTQVAKYYHNRPAYSAMLLEKLIRCINDSNKPLQSLQIVEVGAGTGKLTKMLANFGLQVVAVEPNDNMREEGIKYTQNTTFFIIVICIIYIIYKIISRKEDIESARHEKRKEFEKRKK